VKRKLVSELATLISYRTEFRVEHLLCI